MVEMGMKYADNQKYRLEVCANTIKSAISAQQGGADRIELCTGIEIGGITPSLATIKKAKRALNIDVFVLIRPRSGHFFYNIHEFEIIKNDIIECGKIGCQGIVSGILTETGEIDKKRNKELLHIAKSYGMEATFHRAIDRTKDILKSTEEIIELGFDRILTSGGYPKAGEGISNILKMNNLYSEHITIMPGAGITPENILHIAQTTGSKEFHGTFSSKIHNPNIYYNPKLNDAEYLYETDLNKVEQAKEVLNGLNRR